MSNYDPAMYKPETCKSSATVYGIYLCRLNGGVPCALHKGKMCYAEKLDRATNELIREFNNTIEEFQKFQENVDTIFQDMEEEDKEETDG